MTEREVELLKQQIRSMDQQVRVEFMEWLDIEFAPDGRRKDEPEQVLYRDTD